LNIQEYISSGIIESYVLGLASAEEKAEFEQLLKQFPELVQARTAFEESLEAFARKHAITPPAGTKENIAEQLGLTGKIMNMPAAPARRSNGLKYAVAACIVLMLGSIYLNISMIKKNKTLTTERDQTIAKLNDAEKNMNDARKNMSVITQNPNIRMALMKGMPQSPQSFATVYWDTTTHDVYLHLNNLPAPPSDKQYQLWAIFNNKPVDMGVFDFDDLTVHKMPLLVQLKKADNAQAFAITLEKKGGSPSPEGQMYVMGYL